MTGFPFQEAEAEKISFLEGLLCDWRSAQQYFYLILLGQLIRRNQVAA